MPLLASTPAPPYTAVIFSSVARTLPLPAAYVATAAAMEEMAKVQRGYLGFESGGRGDDGVGISVSYWASPEDARRWKGVAEHAAAQALGRREFYKEYAVRVATVDRAYAWDSE